jgi:hypothetical protein
MVYEIIDLTNEYEWLLYNTKRIVSHIVDVAHINRETNLSFEQTT